MTLSETLISIFIFSLIILTLVGVYIAYVNIYKVQISYMDLNSSTSIGINKINENTRGAFRIVNSATINSTLYTTSHDTLILEMPSIDQNNNIISSKFDYISFYKNGNQLMYDLEADFTSSRDSETKFITEYIDSLIFNFNNIDYQYASKVEIIIVARKPVGNIVQEIIVQSTTALRNKI